MSFTITVNMGGNVVQGFNSATSAANQTTAAAQRTQAAVAQTGAASTAAGNAAAAGGAKAAAGHNAAAKAADAHGDSITKLIHLVEAYFAFHQFEAIIDGYIELRNRIRAVADSQDNLNGLMDATFAVAQHTRTAWEDVASTYQRLGTVTRGLGLSQRQVIDLTEEMALAAKVGGATNREAGASMAELTHAFSTGALQGREFRVLMRDTPSLMHELQVASGKTGGEFAEMGKKGHITAQLLIDWFGKAGPAIAEKFGNTLPTISEGFTMIKNAAEKFFGSAAVGTGVMGALSGAMKFVADHFDAIGKTALAVGEALLGLFVIEKIVVMVKALTVAIAANPIGLLLTGITVGIALLRQFGDQIETNVKVWKNVDGVFVTVADSLGALWTQLKVLGAEIMTFVKEAWGALAKAFGDGLDSSGIDLSLHGAIRLVSGFVGAVRELFHIMADDSGRIWAMISVGIVKAMEAAANGALRAMDAIAAAPRKALFDTMNHTVDKQIESMAAAKRDFNEYLAKHRSEIVDNSKAAIGYGNYNSSGSPNFRTVTPADLNAEVQRRGEIIYKAQLEAQYAQRGLNAQGEDPRNGASGRLFGDIRIPIDSTMAQLAKSGLEDMKNAANVAMKDFDKIEQQIGAQRVMNEKNKPASYVSDVRGKPDAALVDEKEALEKLRNELRSIMEQTNPIVAAQEKLAHAQEIVGKAVDKGLISWAQGATAIADYTRKLEDAIHPHDAWVRKQLDSIAALKNTAEATQDAAKAQAYLDYAKEKGFIATEDQIKEAHRLAVAEREHTTAMMAQQATFEATNGPLKTYQQGIAAAGQLLRDGAINAEKYGRAVDDLRATYLAAKPAAKSFSEALEASWLKLKREAEDFDTTLATTLIGDLDKFNEALTSMANGGKVDFAAMVDSMIQDLERLILKQLEVAAINALISAYTASSSAGSAASGASGGGTASGVGSSLQEIGTPTAQPATAAYNAPAAAAPVVVQNHIHNHYDKSVSLAAIDGPQGQRSVLNVMRANQGAVRKYAGGR
jgi:tape measure domain-containing protein